MPDPVTRRFGRNATALLVGDVAGRFLAAGFRIALAGYLGRVLFGQYSFAAAVALLLGVVADLGLANLTTREVSRRPGKPFDVAGPAIGGRVLLTLVAGGALLLLLSLTGRARAVLELTAILVMAQVATGPAEILAAAHRGRERMIRPAAVALATRLGFVVSGFTAMALGAGVHAFAWLVLFWAVPAVLLLRPGLPGPLTPRVGVSTIRRALAIGIGTVLWSIYFRLDIVLLGFLRDEAEVALFAAPFGMVEAVLMVQGPLLAAAFPVLASRDATDPARSRTFRMVSRSLCAFGLPIAAILFVERDSVLLALFGPQYAGAGTVLAVLALTIPVSFIAAPRLALLIARNRERAYAMIMAAGAATNLLLDILLIPPHGAMGAAVATLATEIVVTILTFLVLRERGVPGGEGRRVARAAAVAVILGTILALLGTLGTPVAVRILATVLLAGPAVVFVVRDRR